MGQFVRDKCKGNNLVLTLVTISPFLWVGFFCKDDFLIRFFPDDAFYYIQTAWNFTNRGSISFDGVNSTNGFHPLFFLLSSFITLLFPKQILLNVFFLLNTFFIFSGIIFCVQHLDNLLNNRKKLLVFLLFSLFPFFYFIWISSGLEAGLVILTTVFFFWAWVQADRMNFTGQRQNLCFGAAITCLMLTRLDLILILVPFVLFLCIKLLLKNGMRLRHAVAVFILPLLGGGLYLTCNIIFTGHAMPVSGVAKKIFAEPFEVSWGAFTGGSLIGSILASLPLMGSLTIFSCAAIPRIRNRFSPGQLSGVLLLNTGLLLYYFYLFFFAWLFSAWYFAFPATVFLISGALLAEKILSMIPPQNWSTKRFTSFLIGVVLFLNVSTNAYFLVKLVPWEGNVSYHLLKISRQIDQLTGHNAVIGIFDAGIIGFFTEARVINLDGLANNFDYLENYLVPGRLQEYFTEQKITHFLVRGEHLVNEREVSGGKYVSAILREDPRIELTQENELFRYSIPFFFSVYLFELKE